MIYLALGGFVLLGAVLGMVGTIIGAGGGFLLVPVLLLLGWPHRQAVGTSLMMVAANAASGSLAYYRQGLVDVASGWRFALCTIPGAVLGSFALTWISGRAFSLIFGALLLLMALYLLWRPLGRHEAGGAGTERPAGWRGWGWVVRELIDRRGERWVYGYAQGWALLLSGVVGFLSSLLGIGGGIIHVPALIKIFGFPAHVATATSHFVLVFTATTGAITELFLHQPRVPQGIALGLGALFGAQAGGQLARRVKGVWIVRGLAAGLLLIGLRLLLTAR